MTRKMLLLDGSGRPELRLPGGARAPYVQTEVMQPGRVVVVIDCSGSMAEGGLDQAKAGSSDLSLQALEDKHEVAVVWFGSEAELCIDLTRESARVLEGIKSLEVSGSTNMAAGIALATDLLGYYGFRTLVIVTDGMPDSEEDAIAAADEAKGRGASIVCIGTDNANADFLKRIATSDCLARYVEKKLLGAEIASAYRLLTGKSAK